ncbi:MAG TPA: hypothetical protein VGC26_04105, partial [Afipia sp.]
WTDAALTLLAVELPAWRLRRMIYDEGEWHCAISHQRELPEWLDDSIETHHENLATAVIKAVLEGLRISAPHQPLERTVRPILDSDAVVNCDNFS